MTRGRRCKRGGFTLIETAATIAVMGAVAALGYGAFATLIDRRAQLRAALVETERAAALRTMLEEWFARSSIRWRTPGLPDFEVPSKDMLPFITRAPTPSRGWATSMLLYIDDNPATPERGLTVRYVGFGGPGGPSHLTFSNSAPVQTQDTQLRRLGQMPTVRQLDGRVAGLRVEYLDRQTDRWVSARTPNIAASFPPIAARVTLEGAPGTPLPPLLQLPFLITQDGYRLRGRQ